MYLHCFSLKKKHYIFTSLLFCLLTLLLIFFLSSNPSIEVNSNVVSEEDEVETNKDYIKYVEFNPTYEVLTKTAKLDILSHDGTNNITYNWIELLAYLAAKYGGDFSRYQSKDLDSLVTRLKSGENMGDITKDMKYYSYFYQSYDSILSEFIGDYEIEILKEDGTKEFQKKYGIKAFLPIAKNYSFNHYKDFGSSRSYGYKRIHLGNDLMGNIGTPIIAVESGIVEAVGWNNMVAGVLEYEVLIKNVITTMLTYVKIILMLKT